MAELYSQYASGLQLTAGVLAGSSLGASGLNPIVDRLNSISDADDIVKTNTVSGTSAFFAAMTVSTADVVIDSNGVEVGDHGTAAVDKVINVCYGTSVTPPTASTTTEGALYIQYTA